MAVITAENRDSWQSLANMVSKEKPDVGRTVRVLNGKHKGKIGKVIRHQLDQYYNAYRYGSPAQHMLTDMMGRYGYVVLIETPNGNIWVKASNTMVCYEG